MPLVGHPHRRELARAQQFGEGNGISTVGLDPLARLPRDQRGRDDGAGMSEGGDQAMQAVAGRTGLVAEVQRWCFAARRLTSRRILSGEASTSPR